MQVACYGATWHCGVMFKLPGLVVYCESEGWWFKFPPGQYFYHGCFFITPRSCMVFCKTFYYQEMARIYPPNAHNSECQILYFLRFSAERSKFLERTLLLGYAWRGVGGAVHHFCYSDRCVYKIYPQLQLAETAGKGYSTTVLCFVMIFEMATWPRFS